MDYRIVMHRKRDGAEPLRRLTLDSVHNGSHLRDRAEASPRTMESKNQSKEPKKSVLLQCPRREDKEQSTQNSIINAKYTATRILDASTTIDLKNANSHSRNAKFN